jgi:hypothetical protein
MTMHNTVFTDKLVIEETITNIFNGSDKHNWEMVRNSFAEEVLLDYSSLSGQPAAIQKADDIVGAWKSFLPKFKFTLHLVTNFEIHTSGEKATTFCKGKAVHHLPGAEGGDVWTVYGTYDFNLQRIDDDWKVLSMKLNLLYQDGNKNLPAIAGKQ